MIVFLLLFGFFFYLKSLYCYHCSIIYYAYWWLYSMISFLTSRKIIYFVGCRKKKLGRFFQFLQFHLLCSLWFEFLSCFCFLCFYFSMLVSYKFRLSSYILFGIDVSCTELINSSKISRSTNKIKTLIIVGPEPIWFFRFF